jgi:hypothetical protein
MKMTKTMKICAAALLSFSFVPRCVAQAKPSHPTASIDPDRLGQTCTQILQMSSAGWVANFEQKTVSAAADKTATTLRAIAAYGKCYEERTNRLAATLGKVGKGPLMGANGNFRAFQKALDDFTAKTLAATHKDPGTTPAAYAALYEKVFRYQFYQSYAQKDFLTRPLTPDESDEMAKAKNRFGEVLGLLPDDTLHAVHTAFRQIFDPAPVTNLTKLGLYRYAIFLLAPAKDKPFSPPPF